MNKPRSLNNPRALVIPSALAFLVYAPSASAEWYDDWFNDLFDYLECLWEAFKAYYADMFVFVFREAMEALAWLVDQIPIPTGFGEGLSSLYGSLDPGVLYFLSQSGVPQAFAILGAGITFRLTRKLITMGRW